MAALLSMLKSFSIDFFFLIYTYCAGTFCSVSPLFSSLCISLDSLSHPPPATFLSNLSVLKFAFMHLKFDCCKWRVCFLLIWHSCEIWKLKESFGAILHFSFCFPERYHNFLLLSLGMWGTWGVANSWKNCRWRHWIWVLGACRLAS